MRVRIEKRVEAAEAARAEINAHRDRLEQAPIALAEAGVWDYDDRARERIARSIAQWAQTGAIKREDGRIPWTLADNTVAWVSLEELQGVRAALDAAIAARSATLHAHALGLKALAPFLPDNWRDTWPT